MLTTFATILTAGASALASPLALLAQIKPRATVSQAGAQPVVIYRPAVDVVPLQRILAARTLAEAQAMAREALGMPEPVAALKVPTGKAEAFHADLRAAQEAAQLAHPDRWHLVPGASGWIEIPASLRSYRSERGAMIRIPEYKRVPAARFWPGGALPHGLTIPGLVEHAAPALRAVPDAPKPAKPARSKPARKAAPKPAAKPARTPRKLSLAA